MAKNPGKKTPPTARERADRDAREQLKELDQTIAILERAVKQLKTQAKKLREKVAENAYQTTYSSTARSAIGAAGEEGRGEGQ